MCGIVGIWNTQRPRPAADVEVMLDAMRHRGPDDRGTLDFAGGAAGMVRLALVDLSARGRQPIWSDDRRVAIIFNGEMYNFRAERERLQKAGQRFHSTTDPEVVLHLYLERGLDFHQHVRGMYALAIFDWRETSSGGLPVMTLARDPLGIKHLYVTRPKDDPSAVMFSSEIRALLASGLVPAEVSSEALAGYLARGFVLQPGTLVEGVRMLEPGTLERYAPGKTVQRRRFWHMPPSAPRDETLEESAGRLRALLDESVRLHAMADAPIGAFLSGGIDSTGIVALMRKHVADLRTYTVRFPDLPGHDEAQEADDAAARYGCRHTVVEATSRDIREILPTFAGQLDQPSADGLNTWLVSRAAASDVKGVLSGLGGDEWFSGYPVTRRMARYATTAGGRAQVVAGRIARRVVPWLPQGRLRQRAENLATRRSALATWLQGHTVFHDETALRMAGLQPTSDVLESVVLKRIDQDSDDWSGESMVGLSCLLDTRVYMISQLLRDSDATSMAHSLELRVPLVDRALVEFSRTCADAYKLRPDGGTTSEYAQSGSKRVLIHALSDVLPPQIARRPKRGFALPFEHWMRGELAPLVEETCGHEAIVRRGLLDPNMAAAVRRRAAGKARGTLYPALWTMMILELWCQAVLDKHNRPTAAGRAISVA